VASVLAYLGRWVDKHVFHLPDFVPWPWNLVVFALCISAGGCFLVWCYSFLILEGEGGPVPPFSSKTKRLVKTGPYSVVRHPSILAKLLGVLGLGVYFNSVTFTFLIVPLLLAGSLITNYFWLERPLMAFFGEEYARYRSQTPLFIPRITRIKALFHK
jgi:protein-S-isoprenylcysteine O-methyltransferase Ste14